jgi:hypothetical protein
MFSKKGKIVHLYRITTLIILLLILLFLPSLLIILNGRYNIFHTFFIKVYIIIYILTSIIPIYFKLTLLIILLSIYRINFKFMIELIFLTSFLQNIIPIAIRKDDQINRYIATKIFTSNFKLHTQFDKLPSFPSILVCNYCKDRIENTACIMFPLDIAILMRDGFVSKLDKLVKWPIFTKSENNYENTKKHIKEHISAGRSIFTYITKPPTIKLDLLPSVRSGIFNIAKELNIPITLVCIDYVDTSFGSITRQNFRICVGETFMVKDVQESKYKSRIFFRDTIKECIRRKYE